jgi:hypothetical protein
MHFELEPSSKLEKKLLWTHPLWKLNLTVDRPLEIPRSVPAFHIVAMHINLGSLVISLCKSSELDSRFFQTLLVHLCSCQNISTHHSVIYRGEVTCVHWSPERLSDPPERLSDPLNGPQTTWTVPRPHKRLLDPLNGRQTPWMALRSPPNGSQTPWTAVRHSERSTISYNWEWYPCLIISLKILASQFLRSLW